MIKTIPFSPNMTSHNYDVADWSSLGHVIVNRHVKNKKTIDLTLTVLRNNYFYYGNGPLMT